MISPSFLMHSFIQQSLIQKLTEWQTENTRLTKELCNDLLTKLKRQHLDPILRQLQGHGGSNLSFDDIIGVYHRIKDDYEGQAVGAKDVIAAAFFDFQPVSNSSQLGYVQTCATTPNNVGSCKPTMLRPFARGYKFERFQTLRNNTQQHPTPCNRVCKRTQHVTSNNVGSCWSTMLRPFARSLERTSCCI